jgi:hypothetical protein
MRPCGVSQITDMRLRSVSKAISSTRLKPARSPAISRPILGQRDFHRIATQGL